MKKLDMAQIQEDAPRGWYLRRNKDNIEAYRIVDGKNLRIWLKVLPGNKLDFLGGVPKYLKIDTQAQLCGKQLQYVPTHNYKNLHTTQDLFNQTGLIDHLLDKSPFIVNPTYKGGATKEEREEKLDEVNAAGTIKEKK